MQYKNAKFEAETHKRLSIFFDVLKPFSSMEKQREEGVFSKSVHLPEILLMVLFDAQN